MGMVNENNLETDGMRMDASTNKSIDPQRSGFATPIEAARFLRLSKAMILKMINQGNLPSCRYGRAIRIPWGWLLRQTEVDAE